MRFISVVLTTAFATVANAHFRLQYPLPRGLFVADMEPTFCGGYPNAVPNRTVFPLSNGVINIKTGHSLWTAGVVISTIQDPTSFADFINSSSGYQMVVPFFQTTGAGTFCFPIDIASSNISGIQEGANVTIQVIFDGGDGSLYQCADLTLSANATIPSDATSNCTDITATVTATTTASSSTATSSSAAGKNMVMISGAAAAVLAGLVSFL